MSAVTGAPIAASVSPALRVFAWLNFIAEALIIGTGGAVRLTGSGLGCPTWPLCTPDSLIPTEELSFHSLIEFGNRMMTGVVGIIAVVTVVLVWRFVRDRRDLLMLSLMILTGVVIQALIGGVLVLFDLHPNLVGVHYVISLILVCLGGAFLVRFYGDPSPRVRVVPLWYAIIAHVATLALAVTVLFGVITTGAGPYSGDEDAGRNGFDARLWEHIHAWPGYILFALTLTLLVAAVMLKLPVTKWVSLVLVAEMIQIAVGLYQARNGLPIFAVGVHMVLASLTAAAMTAFIMSMKQPQSALPADPTPATPATDTAADDAETTAATSASPA